MMHNQSTLIYYQLTSEGCMNSILSHSHSCVAGKTVLKDLYQIWWRTNITLLMALLGLSFG